MILFGGVATSSFQNEGSPLADGACSSDWLEWTHSPGRIRTGETADVATDHYRRYKEDVRLMADLGLTGYRFSIAWPRILPEEGRVNRAGLDFYSRLADELLAHGVEPFATIFHWDMPMWLAEKGGWLNREASERYREYAEVLFDALGDRIKHWMTLNEPYVYMHSYVTGVHYPGSTGRWDQLLRAYHHQLLGHGMAVRAFRERGTSGKIGTALSVNVTAPLSDSDADALARERAEGIASRWFLGALFRGAYPEDMVSLFGELLPEVRDGDMETISERMDFLGVNYYARLFARWDENNRLGIDEKCLMGESPDLPSTYPEGLKIVLDNIHRNYTDIDLYITENGNLDTYDAGDPRILADDERIAYLEAHWEMCRECVKAGLPLKGYFAWTLVDNFEWTAGFNPHFGLYSLDRETLARVPKKSARRYAEFIRTNTARECVASGLCRE